VTFKPRREDFARAVNEFHDRTPLAVEYGIVLEKVEPGRVVANMPLRRELTQQDGIAHAGTLASVADVACGLAAYSLMAEGDNVLSVHFSISLMRPARGNTLRAEGRVVKAGRRLYFTEAEVFAGDGAGEKLVAKAAITMVVDQEAGRSRKATGNRLQGG